MGEFSCTRNRQMELWIGLVELKPLNHQVDAEAGAFTHIVTWTTDPEGFRKKVQAVAKTIEFYLFAVEWAEPVAERLKRVSLSEEIDDMVMRAESNPNAIIWGTFYTYPFNEA